MKKNYFLLYILMASTVAITSCGGKTEVVQETKQEVDNVEEHAENTVSLTNEQIQSIGIETGVIEQKQLTDALKTNGILKVPNQNKASINSVYRGVIRSLLVQAGSMVRKGQIIATVSNPEFIQIQSDYLSVSAKINLAELEVKRQKELNEGNAGALKNLQSAETELRTLRTAQSTYAQQIRLMGVNPSSLSNGKLVSVLSISSPISGVVSSVGVQIGSYIDLSTQIAEVVDNSQLHLDLFVYEKDLPKLQNKQVIHFTLTNNPGKEYDAQIFSLGSSFEGESKAISVHAKVRGDKTGLIDGMNITAVVSLEKKTVPAVPSDAIVTMQGQDYIFVQEEKNQPKDKDTKNSEEQTFQMIPVVKGTTDVGYTEITLLKEVPTTAKVVVKGAFFVMAKLTNTGEHEH